MNRKLLAAILCLVLSMPTYGAMDFDGSDDYVTMGDILPQSGPFTMAGWANPRSHNTNQQIFSRATGSGGNYDQNYLLFERTPDNVWSFQVRSGGVDNEVKGGAVSLNTWTHVAGVFVNASDMRLYVNGSLSNSGGNGTSPASGSGQNVNIGNYNNNSDGGNTFDGLIDDVCIYNRALTAQEIETLASSRSRIALTDGLVGYWPLDEGVDGATASGATAFDRSGNGNHGTPTNGPIWRASEWINYP